MKIANVNGRAALVLGDEIADIATVSDGRFGPDPMRLYDDWDAFAVVRRDGVDAPAPGHSSRPTSRNPVPAPRQVFAIGLNYRSHAEESGMAVPDGAGDVHEVPGVARRPVRRRRARRRRPSTGRSSSSPSSVAAPTASPRPTAGRTSPGSPSARTSATASSSSPPAASSPSASPAAGYGPMGPWVVTLDELAEPRRPRARLLRRRRDDAGRPHQRPDLRRAAAGRRAVRGAAAPPGRHHLHRHPGRHRRHPAAAALPPARPDRSSRGSRASARSATCAGERRAVSRAT